MSKRVSPKKKASSGCPKGKVRSPKDRCIYIGGAVHLKYIANNEMEPIEKVRAPKLKIAPKKIIPKDMKEFLRTINIGFDDLSIEKQHQFYEQMLNDMGKFKHSPEFVFSKEGVFNFLIGSPKYFPLFDFLVLFEEDEIAISEMKWRFDHSEDVKKYTKAINNALTSRKM